MYISRLTVTLQRKRKKQMKNVYLKALVPLLVFAGMQGLGGMTILLTGESIEALAVAIIISGLLTVAVLWKMGMIGARAFTPEKVSGKRLALSFVAAFSCIIAVDLLSELLRLPNLMEEQFIAMVHNVWGVVAMIVVGPIVEELVFREAMLGHMLRNGVDKWSAIVISALLFGVIHGNPIQIPFAFAVGLVFGLIYYKMGNVVLTTIIHIVNNSLAVAEMNLLGDGAGDIHYYDYLGGMGTEAAIIVVCGIICLVATMRIDK